LGGCVHAKCFMDKWVSFIERSAGNGLLSEYILFSTMLRPHAEQR